MCRRVLLYEFVYGGRTRKREKNFFPATRAIALYPNPSVDFSSGRTGCSTKVTKSPWIACRICFSNQSVCRRKSETEMCIAGEMFAYSRSSPLSDRYPLVRLSRHKIRGSGLIGWRLDRSGLARNNDDDLSVVLVNATRARYPDRTIKPRRAIEFRRKLSRKAVEPWQERGRKYRLSCIGTSSTRAYGADGAETVTARPRPPS